MIGKSNPSVTAAIVSGRPDLILRCMDSLRNQSLPGHSFEILIVAEYAVPFALMDNETWMDHAPRSIAAKRNIALCQARSPVIAFLDDDCIADPSWLEKGLLYMNAHPIEIGVQGRIFVPASREKSPNQREFERLMRPLYQTCNIFYRVENVCKKGGFDERFAFQREDVDLGFSLVENGCEIGYEPESMVTHPLRQREYWDLIKTAFRKRYDPLLKKKHPALFKKHFRIFPGTFVIMLCIWILTFFFLLIGKTYVQAGGMSLLMASFMLTIRKQGGSWMGTKWFLSTLISYLIAPWVCIISVTGGWVWLCLLQRKTGPHVRNPLNPIIPAHESENQPS